VSMDGQTITVRIVEARYLPQHRRTRYRYEVVQEESPVMQHHEDVLVAIVRHHPDIEAAIGDMAVEIADLLVQTRYCC
jgi:hypothetical protein